MTLEEPRTLLRASSGGGIPRAAFEKILGHDGIHTLRWFYTAIERCENVARIEDANDTPFGTGFLVRGRDLADRFGNEALLLTNAHVVAEDGSDALAPARAHAVFFASRGDKEAARHRVSQVWSSPRDRLDATLLRLDPSPDLRSPYPIAARLPTKGPPPQRVYAIGHPGGRGLSLSIEDNLLLDYDDRLVHYRTPTEPGSSGSPVFNADWELIALHHAGGFEMQKLDGSGVYPANEGIGIQALRLALQEAAP